MTMAWDERVRLRSTIMGLIVDRCDEGIHPDDVCLALGEPELSTRGPLADLIDGGRLVVCPGWLLRPTDLPNERKSWELLRSCRESLEELLSLIENQPKEEPLLRSIRRIVDNMTDEHANRYCPSSERFQSMMSAFTQEAMRSIRPGSGPIADAVWDLWESLRRVYVLEPNGL